MMHFVTNYDHTHLSESMKRMMPGPISLGIMGFSDLGADTHNTHFADKSNFKKTVRAGLTRAGTYLGLSLKAMITKILKR